MRWIHVVLVLLIAVVWTSCQSQRWIHPSKKEDQLTADWNKCERDWINLQTTNPGAAGMHDSPVIDRQRIYRCLHKNGWRQIED